MTDIDITLNAWEQNYVPVLAVQGESEGRTINAALVDRTGQTDGSFNAASVDRPIDLTGTTVRLYCKKPDGTQTLSDGTITDATNGKASFVLPQQATAAVGNVSAQIYITKPDNSVLKVIGLTLVVQESDLDSIESSDEFDSLVKALNSVEKSVTDAQTAVDNANTAISTVTANEDTRQGNESTRQANETTRQSQETTRQSNESSRKTAETSRTDAETTRESNESARKTAEQARTSAEESRVTAENKRQTDTEAAISSADAAASSANSAAGAANTAADNANHVPQYGGNGNWESWDGTAYADTGKPWKGEKGDTGEKGDKGDKGDPFEYGTSYDTLPALEAAYPSGDTKGHLVGTVAYIWDGSAWKNTGTDLSEYQKTADADSKYVPQTRTVNGKALSNNVTLAAADVSAAPSSHISNTVSTESGVHGLRWYNSKLQAEDSSGNWKDISNEELAPADVSGLQAKAGYGKITISWSDPADTVVDGTTTVKWAGTKLVRKTGSYPANPSDGTALVDNTTRNQYKTNGFVDTGLTNGTTYYYALFPYSAAGAVNSDVTNRVSAAPKAYVLYGVRWHKNQSSPVLERLEDSANFTAAATNGNTAGSSDFDDKPIYKDIKMCNVVNRAVTVYKGEAGFSRAPSSGDVMVEIPKFYYKVIDTDDYRDFLISDSQLDGFSVAPRHAPCTDYPNGASKIYVGAYEAGSGYRSISGAAPLVSETRAQFRADFKNRGTGYSQIDWATQFELFILYLVEYATWDSQSAIGSGYTDSANSAAISTGGADSVSGETGTAGSNSAVKWRNIENLWGNVREWRDGINFNDGLIYVCLNPSKFADDTSANYSEAAYTKTQNSGYISGLGLDANMPWAQIPTAVSGSESTYLCDYYYLASGWRVASVGGSWAHGSDAGLFSLNTYDDSSYSSSYVGSRLLVIPAE